jgi:hypothetical protein
MLETSPIPLVPLPMPGPALSPIATVRATPAARPNVLWDSYPLVATDTGSHAATSREAPRADVTAPAAPADSTATVLLVVALLALAAAAVTVLRSRRRAAPATVLTGFDPEPDPEPGPAPRPARPPLPRPPRAVRHSAPIDRVPPRGSRR